MASISLVAERPPLLQPFNNSVGYSLSDYSSSSNEYGTGHNYTARASLMMSTPSPSALSSFSSAAHHSRVGLTLTQSLPDDISMMVMRSNSSSSGMGGPNVGGSGSNVPMLTGPFGQFAMRKYHNRLPYFLSVPALPGITCRTTLCFLDFVAHDVDDSIEHYANIMQENTMDGDIAFAETVSIILLLLHSFLIPSSLTASLLKASA